MIAANFKVDYPELPVVEHREEFFQLLEKHQVVIVKADTGSGKSTQLPKFLLEWYSTVRHSREGEKRMDVAHGVILSPATSSGQAP